MAMQWTRLVAIVAKPKIELWWRVFGGAGFARTGAIRFRFVRGSSGVAGTATGCSVLGFPS